jgi:hypothetical protein
LSLQQKCDPTWNQVWIKSYMWISMWCSNSAKLINARICWAHEIASKQIEHKVAAGCKHQPTDIWLRNMCIDQ